MLERAALAERPPVCDFCEEEHAEQACPTCNERLCKLCIATHQRRKKTKDHVFVPLSEFVASPVAPRTWV
jgi:hypothetical protein